MVEGGVLWRVEIKGGIGGRRITIAREIVIAGGSCSGGSCSSSGLVLVTGRRGRSTEIRPSGVCFEA